MEGHSSYFPLFMDLGKKKILVIGGGAIAYRRVSILSRYAEHIRVVSPHFNEKFDELGPVELVRRSFLEEDLDEAELVLILTDDQILNDRIWEICRERGILVNHGGNREKCDFYFPAIIEKDEIIAGVTASGKDHSKAKRVAAFLRGCLEGFDR